MKRTVKVSDSVSTMRIKIGDRVWLAVFEWSGKTPEEM